MSEHNPAPADDQQPETLQPAAPDASAGGAVPAPPAAAAGGAPASPAAPARKRRRRIPIWLKGIGVVLLLLILLVLFAPMLASTGPARSFVLNKVNAHLNGRVEATGWSLGWTTGLKANGVRVFDASGRQILQLSSLTTDLTLIDVVRGNFSLGDVVVDGLDFLLRREADGQFNFAKLVKPKLKSGLAPAPQPAPQETPTAAAPAQPAAPATKLPNLSGNIVVRNSRGTFEDVTKGQTVHFPSIDGTVKVPDVNAPIDNALTVVAATVNGQRGTLKLGGTIDVVENNEVHVEAANVDEKIEASGALETLAAFLPPGTLDTLRGDTNATVLVKMTAGQGGFVEASVTSDGFAAGGPALKGDTLTAKQFVLTIPRTSIDMSSGHGSWANWPIRTGGDKPHPIKVALVRDGGQEDTITLGISATAQSLMNVAQNLKPGAAGQVDLDVKVDLAPYAKQLPHVFPEQDGRRLRTGVLAHGAHLKLEPDRAGLAQSLDLTDVTLANADGSTATVEPIHETFSADTLGGGWEMPDLRDIRLVLNSGFAKAEFGGAEIGNLAGNATADLARAKAELGQFLPMQGITMRGTLAVDLSSSGDVTKATEPTSLKAAVTLKSLFLDAVAGFEQFEQGHTFVEASADVQRDAEGVKGLRNTKVIARTGESADALTLDTELTATVDFVDWKKTNPATGKAETVRVAEVPEYVIRRFNADLPAAQRDFPAQFAALSETGLSVDAGVLSLTGSGSYRAAAGLAFEVKGGVNGHDLSAAPADAAPASAGAGQVPPTSAERVTVLRDYTLSIDAAGTYAPGEGGSSITRFARLSIGDNQKMFSLRKGKQDLVIATGGAGVQPAGEVTLGADLKKLNDVVRAASGETSELAVARADDPEGAELTSGRLDAVLRLGPAQQGLLALDGNMKFTQLSVRTGAEPIENEELLVVLKTRSNGDFNYFNVDEATATGRLVNAKVTETVIDLAAGDAPNAPPLAIVPKAKVVVTLPNLRDLHSLWRAISPPEPAVARAPVVAAGEGAKPRAAVGGDRAVDAPEAGAARAPEPRRQRFEKPAPRRDEPRGDEVIGRDVIGRRPGREPRAVEPRRELPAGPADPDGSVTVAPEPGDAPAPPAHVRSGTLTMNLAVGREGGQVVLTSDVAAKELSFKAGTVFKQVGDVNFKTAVRLVPAASSPADATFMQRVRELTIPSLVLKGAGAEIKLEKPFVVRDPANALRAFAASSTRPSVAGQKAPAATASALSAVLNGTVRIGELVGVLEALQGAEPGKMYPYDGVLTIRQELSTAGGAVRLAGQADVKDFTMTGEGAGKFAEPHVGFANTLVLDRAANALRVENVALTMENTKAVQMTMSGTVHELDTARRFEGMLVKLDSDWEKLWDVLRPIMDPETGGKSLEEIKLTGKRLNEIRIEGSYPANDSNAIRSLRVNGGLALDTLATRGLTAEDLDLLFRLEQGVLEIEHVVDPADKATPVPAPAAEGEVASGKTFPPGARCNGSGVLSLQGIRIDLNGDHPRLFIPDGHVLLRDVTINEFLADSLIGRFVNPAFAGADRAKGLLNVTVVSCQGLALDDAMQSPDPKVSGRAELTWTLTDLMLGQPELVALVTKFKPNALNEPGFEGEIRDGKIILEAGQVLSGMTFNIDEYALPFNGGIGLAENKLVNFSVALPPALFAAIDDDFARVVPKEGYKLALTGTTDNWIQNATKSIVPMVADLGVKAAVGGIFDRESDEEKAERRRRVREERAAKARGEKPATMPADGAAPPGREGDDAEGDAPEPRPDDVIGRRPRDRDRADGDRNKADAPADRPADDPDAPAAEPKPAEDPLGELLDRAIGKRETDEEKKARRERVRKERREREERERKAREEQAPAK